MEKRVFGLIGRNIGHSFSQRYFSRRFADEEPDCEYRNFDIPDISEIRDVLAQNPALSGLNVTIPYKEEVIPFLDSLSENARRIGAVNTIKINGGMLEGHNTDWIGFRNSMMPLLKPHHKSALILGTGGASKAVAFALEDLGIAYRFASRKPAHLGYESIDRAIIASHHIIINTTPLGTFPDVGAFPPIPYQFLTQEHLSYDLIYNPAETEFLKRAAQNGAATKNGFEMLQIQADSSWEIWNS